MLPHTAASDLLPLHCDEGERLLAEAGTVDHGPLMQWFQGQKRLRYCSVASSVITLNALRESEAHRQSKFFTPGVSSIRTPEEVDTRGMTLHELASVLAECGARVEVRYAVDETLSEFRERAITNLGRPSDFMIVNYLRDSLGQATGGHFSPLAAWHEATDRFLVLDVADLRYPPVWVPPALLFAAMCTVDGVSGRSRGYVSLGL